MYSKNNNENVHLSVSYDFQNSMGLRKSRCDVPNGTTQGWVCPSWLSIYCTKKHLKKQKRIIKRIVRC